MSVHTTALDPSTAMPPAAAPAAPAARRDRPAARPGSPFRRLVAAELRQVRWQIAAALLCILGTTAATLAAPWPIKLAFDRVLLPHATAAAGGGFAFLPLQPGSFESLAWLCAAVVGIALLAGACGFLQQVMTSRVGFRIVFRLRSMLFDHVQRLSLSFHSRAHSGELMSKITSDTNMLRDVYSESLLVGLTHALTVLGMLTILVALDWRLGLPAALTFPVLMLLLFKRLRVIKASAKKQRQNEGRLAARVGEMLQAVSLVQAFGREKDEHERFDRESRASVEQSIRTTRAEAAGARMVEVITAAGTGLVLLLGGWLTLRGELSPGSLLVAMSYVAAMFKPVKSISRLSASMARAHASVERIDEILALQPEVQDAPDAVPAPALHGDIRFEKVTVKHEGRTVLHELDLHIPAGRRVALVGPSGAGKSTLARLIVRLMEPAGGRVTIDGTDVRRWTRASLREQVGMVLQDNLLFGASVRDNIAYGFANATDEQIEAAARRAQAHEFIMALPGGYDHVLGPGGRTLSGGQRQRLCLARALIKAPPILVLDEPTSAVDAESERQIRSALVSAQQGRTTLVIAHQLHAVADADWIVVLRDGRVVEQGPPDELAVRGGAYAELFQTQAH